MFLKITKDQIFRSKHKTFTMEVILYYIILCYEV